MSFKNPQIAKEYSDSTYQCIQKSNKVVPWIIFLSSIGLLVTIILKKADYIRSNSIAIVPVPRNANYTENPNATQVASEVITDFILSKSAYIPESTTKTDTNNNSSNTGA